MLKEFNIHGKKVTVDPDSRETLIEEKYRYFPLKIFIGNEKWTENPVKEHCLLLKIDDKQYIFVGKTVYSFCPEAQIESSICGSVDKPFVVDVCGGTYLLLVGVYIGPQKLSKDPYFYYENLPAIISEYTNYTGGKYTDFMIAGVPSDLVWKPDRSITVNFGFNEMTIKKNGKVICFTSNVMGTLFDGYSAHFHIKRMKKKFTLL